MSTENIDESVRCIGTTGDTFWVKRYNDADGEHDENIGRNGAGDSNFFRAAQFSADGTSVITLNNDQSLRTFVLPPDLLDEGVQPRVLTAHNVISSPTSVRAFSAYPGFNLQDPSTTLVLSSSKDLAITLHNAIAKDVIHAKYPLIDPWTEEYHCPTSLLWGHDGSHFVAGGKNQLSVFESSRDNEGPLLVHRTSRKKARGQERRLLPGAQCKGLVTALGSSPDGMLAVGTTERQVTLLEREGCGDFVTSFYLDSLFQGKGTGIMQLAWSPCGKYLLIAERQSDCIQLYDMRNTYTRVGTLTGRNADTTQRMAIDVIPSSEGYEVWTGGTDGVVKMWKDPGMMEGEHLPAVQFTAHNDAVSASIWHPTGAVLATCAGQRLRKDVTDESSDHDHGDNSLKLWTWSAPMKSDGDGK